MVLQNLLNGLVEASVIVMAATGLSLIYGVKKFANFAHGDMMTVGAYVALVVLGATGRNYFAGVLGALLSVALLAILFEFLIFSRLEGRGFVAPLVASVGLALVLQNVIRLIWGTGIVTYGITLPKTWAFPVRDPFTGLRVTLNPLQGFVPMVTALVAVVCLTVILQYTKLGRAMRATADNPDLARVTGINVKQVRYATWTIAGLLAGGGGLIIGIRLTTLVPGLGASILLIVFSAVILGGIGSPYGAMLGALVMGLARNLFFPVAVRTGIPEEFSLLIPFGLMVLVLLVRPQGIMGRPVGFDVPPIRAEFRKLLQSLTRAWRRRTRG
jgi:branched-chain amino acid transport system permease protein